MRQPAVCPAGYKARECERATVTDTHRASAVAGIAATVIALGGIVGATIASPTFRWAGNALSDLGQPGDPAATPTTTLLFDGGLVLGGVVGLLFARTLWMKEHALERVAAVPFAVALVGMAGVGVFPYSQPLHVPAALTLYLGSMVAMALYTVGNALAGETARAAVTVGLVAAHVGVWWWWIAGGEVTRGGLAIPETIGAAIFGAWVCWTAAWQLAGRR